ncbi:aldo/keto reductase [Streptomyces sp. NPDC005476]|uniref:aldo/keto reductase n=1 Tax=Streptomyces sp. NPDC005476 TaxID=3156882 RepID=UPI0034528E5D
MFAGTTTIIVQLDGAKRWRIYGATRPFPLRSRTRARRPPTRSPCQDLLAPALTAHPALRIATKAGYFTAATGADAVNAGVLTQDHAMAGHSVAPDYVRWQMGRSREQLGRERLDLVLLHTPEPAHPGDRPALHRAMLEAFVVLEEAGHVAGYGIATWAGLEEESFTVGELLALAAEATGGRHHAVQLLVSLVMMAPIVGP